MEINFGTLNTNLSIIFDSSQNANYGFINNNNFWIHGTNWRGKKICLPYGLKKAILSDSKNFNGKVQISNSIINTSTMFLNCNRINQNSNT